MCTSATTRSRSNAGKGYLYILQEREFFHSGEDVYKVGRTSRDVVDRFKEYPKGSRLLFIMHVPVDRAALLEDEVKRRFRAEFRPRVDIGSESFVGPWLEMAQLVMSVVQEDERVRCTSADVERRTGMSSASGYNAIISRFLSEYDEELRGCLVPLESLDQMFASFVSKHGLRGMPLLRDPLFKACREVGAVAFERIEVQFRQAGQSSLLDAGARFREYAFRDGCKG